MRWDHTSQCQQEMTIDIHLHHRVQTVHGTQRRRCPRQCGSEKICVFRMSNYHEMLHYRTASNIASCETVDKTQRLSHEAVECWRCRWAPHSPDHSEQHTHTHTYTHTHTHTHTHDSQPLYNIHTHTRLTTNDFSVVRTSSQHHVLFTASCNSNDTCHHNTSVWWSTVQCNWVNW